MLAKNAVLLTFLHDFSCPAVNCLIMILLRPAVLLLLEVRHCQDAILDYHHTFIELFHVIERILCLLSIKIDPHSAEEGKVMLELIAYSWVLMIHLHFP